VKTIGKLKMKHSPKMLGGAAVGTIVGFFVSTVRAEAPPPSTQRRFPVAIVVARCVKMPPPDLQRIVGAELGIDVAAQLEDEVAAVNGPSASARRVHTGEDPNVTRVTIACVEPWLRLEVLDPVSGKTLVRHLDLPAQDASTRTRMLGLSIAELVAASWIELTARPVRRPHIVEATADASARDLASQASRKALAPPSFYRLEAVASAQRTGSVDLLTLGGGAGASWVRNGWQVIGVDVLVESGSEEVSLGTVRTLLSSASASMRIRQQLGPMAIEGGLGARGGFAYMQGEAADITPQPSAATATLPWWGPMIMVSAEASVAQRVALVVRFEAGRVLFAADARAGGRTGVAIDNQWLGITVGPSLTLGDAL
jgi:hypothetical protein